MHTPLHSDHFSLRVHNHYMVVWARHGCAVTKLEEPMRLVAGVSCRGGGAPDGHSKKLTHRQSTSQNCSLQQKTQREKTRSPQPPPRHPTVLNRMASTGQRLRRSVTRGEADHGGWRFRRGCPFQQFASLAAFILKKDVRGSIFAVHISELLVPDKPSHSHLLLSVALEVAC